MIENIARDPTIRWNRAAPADSEALDRLRASLSLELPDDYIAFLAISNGGEGDLQVEPGWFQLWSAEQIPELNAAYGVEEFLPGFLGIGSDGGDTMFAFDTRGAGRWPIYCVPFIGMDPQSVELIASDFLAFVRLFGQI